MWSFLVIAQSIAKGLAPTCFQNEAHVSLNMFCTNVFSKHVGTQKHIGTKHVQKQGLHFENMLLGLTYTNNGSYMGQQTDLSLPLYI